MLELLGTEENGVYRFDITKDILDLEHKSIDSSKIIIPIKRPKDSYTYDDIFELMAKDVDDPNYYQTPTLDLVIESGTDTKCYIGSNQESDFYDGVYKMVQINLDESEHDVVNQLLVA